MNAFLDSLETFFGGLPLPILEVWGTVAFILGILLAISAYGGFTFRPGGGWGIGRERQAWDSKAVLSVPLTFVLIIATGYLGSFVVLVPGAQTLESAKDLVVLLCIILFGYPALITVPFAYGLSDLIEGVPPEYLLEWLPGYFINPACFWIAYQLIGKRPDFLRAKTWGYYLLFVLLFMSIEPVLWGYICSGKFTPAISYSKITPALFFTTAITWFVAPFAMLGALPLARKFGLFWARIPGHVKERLLGSKEWIWVSGSDEPTFERDAAADGWPIRMVILTPFIGLVLLMVGLTAFVTLRSAESDAHRLATRLHEEMSANIGLLLDEYFEQKGVESEPLPGESGLNELLSTQPVAQNGIALILTKSGTVVASSVNSSTAAKLEPLAAKATEALVALGSTGEQLSSGVQFSFAHVTAQPLAREPWLARAVSYRGRSGEGQNLIVLTAMPESFYLAGVQTGNSRSAMIFAVALLLSIGAGALLAAMVTNRLKKISRAAELIAQGDLSQRVPGSKLDELDTLSHSFNDMTQTLERAFANLNKEVRKRKAREQELEENESRIRASENRVQLAIRAADLAIWDWNVLNDTLVWDDAMYELYGVGKDDFGGAYEAWASCLEPQDFAKATEDVKAALEGTREFNTEFRVRMSNGSVRLIGGTAQVIRDEHGHAERMVGVNWDVTKRKEAEETLDQIVKGIAPATGTDFFLQLANHLSRTCQVDYAFVGAIDSDNADGIHSIAASFRGETVNNFSYHLAKTPCENVVGKELCYYPAGIQEAFPEDELLAQMGIESYMGVPLKSNDGKPLGLIALLHGQLMANPRQAETVLRVVASRSSAELERALFEESLLEAHEFNAQVFAGSQHGLVVLDRDLRYRMWNPAMERMTGLPAEKVLGTHPEDFPFLRDSGVVDSMRRALDGEITASDDVPYHIPGTGRRGWASNIVGPMRDSKGSVIGVLSSVIDTTSRRTAQDDNRRLMHALGERVKELTCLYKTAETLRDNTKSTAEWIEAIVSTLPDGWQYPDDTAACIRYGNFESVTPGFERTPWLQRTDFVDTSGTPGSIEVVYFSEHPPEAEGAFLAEERKLIDSLAEMLRYAINRRNLEEQVRQAQKMEAIGQLAGGVAHDFNNLLTIINGYSELILNSMAESDPTRPRLEQILRAGKRSATLTQQLLAFSRKQVLAPRTLNLNDIVFDTEKMLQRIIGEDITLMIDLHPELKLVMADPGQIEQVLLNLAINARDAMPRGGRLSIETRNVSLPGSTASTNGNNGSASHILLAVIDTGVGMSEEIKQHIFEPFYTTKSPGKGTGLGLAVVHGIVKQSDGQIEVSSNLGSGTIFNIYLPTIAEGEMVAAARESFEPAPTGTETILLVEDEADVRKLTRLILSEFGYDVLDAEDGESALRLCRERTEPVDLIVTDVVMPGMGGLVFAQKAREIFPDVKVLFVSGYPDDDVVRHGILHQQVNFLSKPFSANALGHKVREVLKS